MTQKTEKAGEKFRENLTDQQYRVCWQKGTEAPFTGEYWNSKEPGVYRCVCCGEELFTSDTKFDSGTGWPSFFRPVADAKVETEEEDSHFMRRTEVHCGNCGAHLGHVFTDGPKPTGLRYCINSASLKFERR